MIFDLDPPVEKMVPAHLLIAMPPPRQTRAMATWLGRKARKEWPRGGPGRTERLPELGVSRSQAAVEHQARLGAERRDVDRGGDDRLTLSITTGVDDQRQRREEHAKKLSGIWIC